MSKQDGIGPFLGKGWSFPPTFDKSRRGVKMSEGVTDIQESLQILLTTELGERLMQPEYGTFLSNAIFESLDTSTETAIRDIVETAILIYEPRVDLNKVDASNSEPLEGKVVLEIDYTVRSTNTRYNLVLPFYLEEATNVNT